jgi:hypothetical protein
MTSSPLAPPADAGNVVDFAVSPEEKQRRLMVEVHRLAGLATVDWTFQLQSRAAYFTEHFGVSPAEMKALILARLKDIEKAKAEERRIETRDKKKHKADVKEKEIVETEKQKAEAAAKKAAKQEAERAKREAEKEAERKAKEKAKTFGNIMRLPVARHEKELQRLAERLDEDVVALREEFQEFLGVGVETSIEKTEPWPEPIDTATLLQECGDKISRYVVQQEHQLTASVLWAAHCWLYDHNVPTYSPLLAPTSAEPDSGKTTLVAVIGRTTPRYSLNIEMTGPSLYRFVDAIKPTLVIDEADDLFVRKSDLKHIINAGWTRGAKIPRQVNINGAWMTVYFDPFTPKAIALLGRNLPPATRTRSIELRMSPKREDEKVETFSQLDDAEFAVLRRKFARWAVDNATSLKEAKPTVPSGLNNRAAMNWMLLLAIAELAGGDWPERAREAAGRLTRKGRQPSDGVKLLAAIRTMFVDSGKQVIASRAIVAELIKNPTDIWVAYNHGGAVTQRQIAHLLSAYEITPDTVHPTGRSSDSPQGYKLAQFEDAFARYLANDPHIHTSPNKPQRKKARKRWKK